MYHVMTLGHSSTRQPIRYHSLQEISYSMNRTDENELYLVSPCILGIPTRWDGGQCLVERLVKLAAQGRLGMNLEYFPEEIYHRGVVSCYKVLNSVLRRID